MTPLVQNLVIHFQGKQMDFSQGNLLTGVRKITFERGSSWKIVTRLTPNFREDTQIVLEEINTRSQQTVSLATLGSFLLINSPDIILMTSEEAMKMPGAKTVNV